MRYYIAHNIETPYGDYSDIIYSGYICTFYFEKIEHVYNNVKVFKEEMRDLDIAEVWRTGPYVPDIYMAANGFAMTEIFMKKLMNSGLKGINNLKPTVKKKIINLPWKSWSKEDWENHIEELHEPEDSLEYGEHDEVLANSMPNIFYFIPMTVEKCKLSIENEDSYNERFVLDETPDLDVFMASNMLFCIVSDNFKKFLDENTEDRLLYNEIYMQQP